WSAGRTSFLYLVSHDVSWGRDPRPVTRAISGRNDDRPATPVLGPEARPCGAGDQRRSVVWRRALDLGHSAGLAGVVRGPADPLRPAPRSDRAGGEDPSPGGSS